MVRVHANALHSRRLGIDQFPTFSVIRTAPQSRRLRITHVLVFRVKYKKFHHSAQVEHPPRLAAVVADVSPRHVATYKNGIDVMRANRGMEHSPSSARADYFESAGTV